MKSSLLGEHELHDVSVPRLLVVNGGDHGAAGEGRHRDGLLAQRQDVLAEAAVDDADAAVAGGHAAAEVTRLPDGKIWSFPFLGWRQGGGLGGTGGRNSRRKGSNFAA